MVAGRDMEARMKARLVRSVAAGALFVGTIACTASSGSVGVTTSESLVAGCQKVGDVAISEKTAPGEIKAALSDAARKQGANYVLLSSDGARSGAAYRCQTPATASR
jgi:hypothetical protein